MCSGAVLSCQKMAFWTPSYFLYSGAVFRFKKTAFWTTSDFLCSVAVLSFQKTAFWTPSDFVLLRYSPLLSENGVLNAIWFCFTQVLSLVVRKWCSKRQLILFYLGTLLSCQKYAFWTPSGFLYSGAVRSCQKSAFWTPSDFLYSSALGGEKKSCSSGICFVLAL